MWPYQNGHWALGQRRQRPPKGQVGLLRPPCFLSLSSLCPPRIRNTQGPWFSGNLAGLLETLGPVRAQHPLPPHPRALRIALLRTGTERKSILFETNNWLWVCGGWWEKKKGKGKEEYKGESENKGEKERKAILPFCKPDSREFICMI